MYTGRFAPTASGLLHFGSIVTAIASYLDAKTNHGKWLVKIDDIDQPRVSGQSEHSILFDLEHLGLQWDGKVIHQSNRLDQYQYYLDELKRKDYLYLCDCSRKIIYENGKNGVDGIIYNGLCKNKNIDNPKKNSLRIKVKDNLIIHKDQIQGVIKQNLAEDIGDFILKRSDQIFAYQFTVVIDNYLDKVTHVCRGYDLINSLFRQYYLHEILGFKFPKTLHIPIATVNQKKLSKGHGDNILVKGNEKNIWINALKFLGQPILESYSSMSLQEIIDDAIANWSIKYVSKSKSIEVDEHIHTLQY